MNEEYLDFAKQLAEEAGKIMMRYFRADDIGKSWKEDETIITIADTKINDLVIDAVKKKYPSHGVLAEEGSYKPKRQTIWVMDPIDGTVPYSAGIPVSTFSLALVDRKDGQPIVGVVYDPFLERVFYSIKGTGAYLNSKELNVTPEISVKRRPVSVLGYRGTIDIGQCIKELYAQDAICFSLVSQAYSAVLIATGDFVGSVFAYNAPWDNAAASLIVEEAGGIVTDLDGKQRRYDEFGNGSIMACSQKVHEILTKAAKNADHRN